MTDLKKCPLCGNEAVLDKGENGYFSVRCDACCSHTKFYCSENAAKEMWNNRKRQKLKKCPICGRSARLVKSIGRYQIFCPNCDFMTLFGNDKKTVERIWNTRIEENDD